MNKPLLIRVGLVCLVVAVYLVASEQGWYPKLAGPLAVLAVAAVAVRWALRTFRPEIDRARRIRRANRGGELER